MYHFECSIWFYGPSSYVAFRKKIYRDLASLQSNLDEWIDHYNHERTHQGKMCCGRIAMQKLEYGKQVWKQKKLN